MAAATAAAATNIYTSVWPEGRKERNTDAEWDHNPQYRTDLAFTMQIVSEGKAFRFEVLLVRAHE
jgi:hypothetical protein